MRDLTLRAVDEIADEKLLKPRELLDVSATQRSAELRRRFCLTLLDRATAGLRGWTLTTRSWRILD